MIITDNIHKFWNDKFIDQDQVYINNLLYKLIPYFESEICIKFDKNIIKQLINIFNYRNNNSIDIIEFNYFVNYLWNNKIFRNMILTEKYLTSKEKIEKMKFDSINQENNSTLFKNDLIKLLNNIEKHKLENIIMAYPSIIISKDKIDVHKIEIKDNIISNTDLVNSDYAILKNIKNYISKNINGNLLISGYDESCNLILKNEKMIFFDKICFQIETFNFKFYIQDYSINNRLILKSNEPIILEKDQIIVFGDLLENKAVIKKLKHYSFEPKENNDKIYHNLNINSIDFSKIVLKNKVEKDFIQFYDYYYNNNKDEIISIPYLEIEFIEGINKGNIIKLEIGINYYEEIFDKEKNGKTNFSIGRDLICDINIHNNDMDKVNGYIIYDEDIKKWILKSKNKNSSFLGIMLHNNIQYKYNKISNIHEIKDNMEFIMSNTNLKFKIKNNLI